MFLGNNHLGGQDFNERIMNHMLKQVSHQYNQVLSDPEDLQTLRLAAEEVKLKLSTQLQTQLTLKLHSLREDTSDNNKDTDNKKRKPVEFEYSITREMFEDLNKDLFQKVLEPIEKVLEAAGELPRDWVDEVVLVGGSTRIPRVRRLIRDFFSKEPNTAVDPELAVASGVAIQAGILGGMWPLTVSATELPTRAKKIHVR